MVQSHHGEKVEETKRSVKKIEVQKIAVRIRLLRRERGLTQQELAALCNFPGPWKISRLEGGKKGSGIERLDTLEIVCQKLGIELWELLKPDWDVAGEEEVTK
jgi:transcriptional regulator with XRE-family HTH domain